MAELHRVKESMELWLETFDMFCSSSHMLGGVFKNFFSMGTSGTTKNSTYLYTATAFEEILKDLKNIIQPSVKELFINRCLKPLLSILALVPPINEQILSRKTMLLDFDSFRAKLEKEIAAGRDASHPSSNKNLAKLDESSKRLWEAQLNIYALFDEFENAKGIMLGAEFTAFLGCFYHHSSATSDLVGLLLPALPQVCSSLAILDSKLQIFSGNNAQQTASAVLLETLAPRKSESSSSLDQKPDGESDSVDIPSDEQFSAAANSNLFLQLPSARFIAKLEKEQALNPLPPIVRRTEILGGAYGGYGVMQQQSNSAEGARRSTHMYIANELKSQLLNSSKKHEEPRGSIAVYYEDAYNARSEDISDLSPFFGLEYQNEPDRQSAFNNRGTASAVNDSGGHPFRLPRSAKPVGYSSSHSSNNSRNQSPARNLHALEEEFKSEQEERPSSYSGHIISDSSNPRHSGRLPPPKPEKKKPVVPSIPSSAQGSPSAGTRNQELDEAVTKNQEVDEAGSTSSAKEDRSNMNIPSDEYTSPSIEIEGRDDQEFFDTVDLSDGIATFDGNNHRLN